MLKNKNVIITGSNRGIGYAILKLFAQNRANIWACTRSENSVFKEELKKYINLLILKIKIVFVITVFFITCVAFAILTFGDASTAFKHTLEWNYFAFLLLYYLFSRFLWK